MTLGWSAYYSSAPQTLFIESACNDERIIEENVRSVKISSPDVGLKKLQAFRSDGLQQFSTLAGQQTMQSNTTWQGLLRRYRISKPWKSLISTISRYHAVVSTM